jgi:uncharacterized small protein (DUF1192 family)
MSTTHSAGPGPASSNALIESAYELKGVTAIDRRIATLRERIEATGPRFAWLVPDYWEEIDHLLDLRLWLTGAARA